MTWLASLAVAFVMGHYRGDVLDQSPGACAVAAVAGLAIVVAVGRRARALAR